MRKYSHTLLLLLLLLLLLSLSLSFSLSLSPHIKYIRGLDLAQYHYAAYISHSLCTRYQSN